MALTFTHRKPHVYDGDCLQILAHDGQRVVGEVDVCERDGGARLQVQYIEVDEERQRERIGTRLYEQAAQVACERGKPLSSDPESLRSAKASGFWEKQRRRGRVSVVGTGADRRYVLDQACYADLSGMRGVRRRGLGQAEASTATTVQPTRRRWLWVVLAVATSAGVFFVSRRALAARKKKGAKSSAVVPGAPAEEQPARKSRVVVLGDSLTVGYLPKLKALLPGVEVVGEGWTGKQVAAIHSNGSKYLDDRATQVVVLGGINDVASGKTAQKAGADLISLWRAAKATGARLTALTLLPCPRNQACQRAAGEREKLNQFIRQSRGIDGGPDVVVDLDDFDTTLLAGDGLHPTAAGYQMLAQRVAQAIQ